MSVKPLQGLLPMITRQELYNRCPNGEITKSRFSYITTIHIINKYVKKGKHLYPNINI